VAAAAVALTALAAPATAAPPVARAGAFHSVALSALARHPGGMFDDEATPFRWAVSGYPGIIDGAPTAEQRLLQVKHNRCRSVHMDFVAGGTAQSAWIGVVQRGRPAVGAETTYRYLGTLDAKLTPGRPWTLIAATPATSLSVYVNGKADCR
jgi:hypothetical protein